MTTDYGLAIVRTKAPDYEKDPSDTIEYSQSWHQLGADTIIDSEWSSDGLTVGTSSVDGLTTTVSVSGGSEGAIHNLTNLVTTGMGRVLERSIYVAVTQL